jgi:hypothetical protein
MELVPVGAAAFIVAWVLLVASMVYSVVEGVSFFALQPWAFRHGPIVLRQHCLSPNQAACTSRAIQLTESGRFRFVEPNMAVFCFGRSWFGMRLRTAVSIKGTIEWRDGSAEIFGRLPVGTLLVSCFWLLCAAVWSILAAFARQGSWKFLWVLPAAVAFGFLMGPIFLPLEKRRALRVADEILRAAR